MLSIRLCVKKKEIKIVILLVSFLLFIETPYALLEINALRYVYAIFRLLFTGGAILICLRRGLWNKFDMATLLFCAVIIISALYAIVKTGIAVTSPFNYMRSAYTDVIFIVGQLSLAKIAFGADERICLLILKVIYRYYLVLCLLNLATQLMGWEIQSQGGNRYFLGLDNNIGKYYLFAFFYACVIMALEEKKFSGRLIFMAALTIFEGIYRNIGGLTAISLLMAGLVVLFFLMPKSYLWKLHQDFFLRCMIVLYILVMTLYSKLNVLQDFINVHLYGKAASLTTRFKLQTLFLHKWFKSPLWGSAAILSRAEWGDSLWFDYALRGGHTHNYLIETLYNFGIFAFILYIILLLLGIRKIHGYSAAVSFVGVAFFLVFLRGMFENLCWEIFAVLPTMYYLGVWCARKYEPSGDKVL